MSIQMNSLLVLAYVIIQDSHEAHVAVVRTGRRQHSSSAGALWNNTVRSFGNASTILPRG